MLRRLALVLTGALALSTTAGASTGASSSTPSAIVEAAAATAPAVRFPAPPPPESLLISDSAWLSFRLYDTVDAVQGFEHTLALASCRRRVATSCTNFDGFVPITLLEELEAHPDGFTTLIVATGYNDGDRAFEAEVDQIADTARSLGYERIVWLTLRSNVTYESPDDAGFAAVFERNNATLERIVASGTHPEIVIADWGTYARDQPTWFSSDGIHLRLLGSYAAADYISRKMAHLDSRACPQPAAAGATRLDPCPDPDGHGPTIDLASLYPVTRRGPDATFELSYEGSGSWPEPAWWVSGA